MRVAGIDLGTNTFLCLIADVSESGVVQVIRDEVRVVRLGQGVHATREFHPEALARAESTFEEFQKFILDARCEKVVGVATSAARDVKNADVLFQLGKKYGIPIEVISGDREAELTFAGAIEPSWSGLTAVIDVGGGSTEIIIGDRSGVRARASADVGAVRLTEMFVKSHPIPSESVRQLRDHARQAISSLGLRLPPGESLSRVVAVAGTPTTLASVVLGRSFDADRVHGHLLSLAELDSWTTKLAGMSVEERQKLSGMEPKRADVIVAGAICVAEALRFVGSLESLSVPRNEIVVSVRGLRFGIVQMAARA